jgi:UDPglucose--hexose-1-phosphate uridylyltransferase
MSMPELRQNRYTKEWVVLATERAKRPEEMVVKRERKALPQFSPTCPFCPGNEKLAPPAVLTVGDGNASWKLRVVPNKFAALSREGEPQWKIEKAHRSMNGVGIHDVVVETRDHSLTTAQLPDEQVAEILRAYKRRFEEMSADPRIAHVSIFKNHGVAAGTSLEHPHSQIIATPVISQHVRSRMFEALRHFDEWGECIFCGYMNQEIEEGTRIVMNSRHFVALEPFASPSPFYTHIYPKRHMASFSEITYQEIVDLAKVLKSVLGKLFVGLEDPDFNLTIPTAAQESAGVKFYHWYINIIPRMTRTAGFELGSGMFINTVTPESAAEFLRNVDAEKLSAAAGND